MFHILTYPKLEIPIPPPALNKIKHLRMYFS